MQVIHYTKGKYKYQLKDDAVSVPTGIRPISDIFEKFIVLREDGLLTVFYPYAWDGPSGPTIDTKSFMRGSLFHDALYQLMRLEKIDRANKDAADRLLRQICITDGMFKPRAWLIYVAVKLFGKAATHPDNKQMVYTAP